MAQAGQKLSLAEVMDLYDQALPFGITDAEEVEKEVRHLMATKSQSKDGISLMGFIDFLWNQDRSEDADDGIEEINEEMAKIQEVPRIDWTREYMDSGEESLSRDGVEALVHRLEGDKKSVLLRLPEELKGGSSTHPSFRTRVLTLWYNQGVR
ncbi:MAG: hypothetical protein GY852_09800 [bacterium]|nr:hypothetical protein [bacterium]